MRICPQKGRCLPNVLPSRRYRCRRITLLILPPALTHIPLPRKPALPGLLPLIPALLLLLLLHHLLHGKELLLLLLLLLRMRTRTLLHPRLTHMRTRAHLTWVTPRLRGRSTPLLSMRMLHRYLRWVALKLGRRLRNAARAVELWITVRLLQRVRLEREAWLASDAEG
jgi:hypothetical protein